MKAPQPRPAIGGSRQVDQSGRLTPARPDRRAIDQGYGVPLSTPTGVSASFRLLRSSVPLATTSGRPQVPTTTGAAPAATRPHRPLQPKHLRRSRTPRMSSLAGPPPTSARPCPQGHPYDTEYPPHPRGQCRSVRTSGEPGTVLAKEPDGCRRNIRATGTALADDLGNSGTVDTTQQDGCHRPARRQPARRSLFTSTDDTPGFRQHETAGGEYHRSPAMPSHAAYCHRRAPLMQRGLVAPRAIRCCEAPTGAPVEAGASSPASPPHRPANARASSPAAHPHRDRPPRLVGADQLVPSGTHVPSHGTIRRMRALAGGSPHRSELTLSVLKTPRAPTYATPRRRLRVYDVGTPTPPTSASGEPTSGPPTAAQRLAPPRPGRRRDRHRTPRPRPRRPSSPGISTPLPHTWAVTARLTFAAAAARHRPEDGRACRMR
jgi:hypothetical protein